jgi:hypothetical protein
MKVLISYVLPSRSQSCIINSVHLVTRQTFHPRFGHTAELFSSVLLVASGTPKGKRSLRLGMRIFWTQPTMTTHTTRRRSLKWGMTSPAARRHTLVISMRGREFTRTGSRMLTKQQRAANKDDTPANECDETTNR